MSEYYGHAVHGADCAALIQASGEINERTKQIAREHKVLMRMGSVLRVGRLLVTPALTAVREGTGGEDQRAVDRRIAIALAQLSHRATDGYFKPLYRKLAPEYYDNGYALSPSDMRILHDAVLFHARKDEPYARGDPLFDPLLFHHAIPLHEDQNPAEARHLELIFSGRVTQELLSLHDLFGPDAGSDRRLRSYIMALDPAYIDTVRYADMASQPFLNLVQRYIVDVNFYDSGDPWIALAVDIQNGAPPDPERLAAAKATPEAELSQWGTTLALGVRYYEAAQAYMDGRIGVDVFQERALSS